MLKMMYFSPIPGNHYGTPKPHSYHFVQNGKIIHIPNNSYIIIRILYL